jgi:flagellar biosynthesis protein FliR
LFHNEIADVFKCGIKLANILRKKTYSLSFMNILDFTNFRVEVILFTFFRISGLFLLAPLFSMKSMPKKVKVMLGFIIAMVISPMVAQQGFTVPQDVLDVITLGVRELLVGLLIGFVFYSLFVGVQMAGAFIGFQMGFAIVNVIDPVTSQQVAIMSQFKYIMATLIFFLLDGHHMILQAVVASYKLIPIGEAVFRFSVYQEIARLIMGIFVIGIKLAAPVMVTLILLDVGLGVVSRSVPQMNIFIVGFPMKIGLGLFFTAAALPIFGLVFNKALVVFNEESYNLISQLAR